MSLQVFLILSAVLIGCLYYFMFVASAKKDSAAQPTGGGNGEEPKVVNRGGAAAAEGVRNRRAPANAVNDDDDDDDGAEEEKERFQEWAQNNNNQLEGVADEMADRKFTKKELQRQEKMQQRRQQREAMAQQREMMIKERNEKDAKKEEADRKREERDRMIEEQERRDEEEKARKEQDEVEYWKAQMQVEEPDLYADESVEARTKRFIEYIERRKVVMLEDIAAEFKMQTSDVVTRIEELEREGSLSGITDDQGKFIHITPEEYAAVADLIKRSGRISTADLSKEATNLVRMAPTDEQQTLLKQEQTELLARVEKVISSDKK